MTDGWNEENEATWCNEVPSARIRESSKCPKLPDEVVNERLRSSGVTGADTGVDTGVWEREMAPTVDEALWGWVEDSTAAFRAWGVNFVGEAGRCVMTVDIQRNEHSASKSYGRQALTGTTGHLASCGTAINLCLWSKVAVLKCRNVRFEWRRRSRYIRHIIS